MNLDRAWVWLPCPVCTFEMQIQISQLRLGAYRLCPGCHRSVRLEDPEASVHRANEEVSRMITEFTKSLSKFGRKR